MIIAAATSANERVFRDGFEKSFMSACEKGVHERAVQEFAALAGMPPEKLRSGVSEKIRSLAAPALANCSCLRDKIKTVFDSKSPTEAEVTIDMSALSLAPECSPSAETAAHLGKQFQRLLQSMPPAAESLRVPRRPFSITASAPGRLSLFASRQAPPQELGRLVFFAPGTGSACSPLRLCVSESMLEVLSPSDHKSKYAIVLGTEGPTHVNRIAADFGDVPLITTSPHNFTNFVPTRAAGQFSYSVVRINDQPIEQSTEKRLWLVIFSSPTPVNPRTFDYTPALATVVEVEFLEVE